MNTSSALAVADALANKKELKKIDFNGEQKPSLPSSSGVSIVAGG